MQINNPPLLHLQTKTDSPQVSSTNNLAQLLKNIGAVGVIELPELLSDKRKANDVLQEEKPNNIPPTENNQQENESYESESEDEADENESKKGHCHNLSYRIFSKDLVSYNIKGQPPLNGLLMIALPWPLMSCWLIILPTKGQ